MPASFALVIERLVPFERAHQINEPLLLSPGNEFLERLGDGGLLRVFSAHLQSKLDELGIDREVRRLV